MTDDQPSSATSIAGYEVMSNTKLSADVHKLVVRAPRVAAVRQPGQFVIVRLGPGAERIPLTIAESDSGRGIDRARHPGGRQEHVRSGGARSRRPDPRHRRSARPAERSCRRWHGGLRGRRGRRGGDAIRLPAGSPSSASR